jgi:hypothetical protein
MGRSIEGLRQRSVEFSDTIKPCGSMEVVRLGEILRDFNPDWEVSGDGTVSVDVNRLLSALELASPSRIGVSKDNGRVLLHITGLPERGIACLESQTSTELLALAALEGRDWGVVLLKETVRAVGGSTISVTDTTSVTIGFDSEV